MGFIRMYKIYSNERNWMMFDVMSHAQSTEWKIYDVL